MCPTAGWEWPSCLLGQFSSAQDGIFVLGKSHTCVLSAMPDVSITLLFTSPPIARALSMSTVMKRGQALEPSFQGDYVLFITVAVAPE